MSGETSGKTWSKYSSSGGPSGPPKEADSLDVQFGPSRSDPDVLFTHADWTLSLDLDVQEKELIFNAVLPTDKWLAIALARNFIETDVI